MKVLQAPDLHAWLLNYGGRKEEFEAATQYMLRSAIEKGVKVAVFPGDLFDSPLPNPDQTLAVIMLFRQFEEHGIQVIAGPGNHDHPQRTDIGPCNVVRIAGKESWGMTAGGNVVVDDVTFTFLPFYRPAWFTTNIDQLNECKDFILEQARAYKRDIATAKSVLIAHYSLDCSIEYAQEFAEKREVILPLRAIHELGYDAYMFGHVHEPQLITATPFTAYSGALLRKNYGEATHQRGCYIYDMDAGTHEWIPHPARNFVTVWLDEQYNIPEEKIQVVDEAFVQVFYQANPNEIHEVDHKLLKEQLLSFGAFQVTGIYPQTVQENRVRDAEITEHISDREAFRRTLAKKRLPEELTAKIMATWQQQYSI